MRVNYLYLDRVGSSRHRWCFANNGCHGDLLDNARLAVDSDCNTIGVCSEPVSADFEVHTPAYTDRARSHGGCSHLVTVEM